MKKIVSIFVLIILIFSNFYMVFADSYLDEHGMRGVFKQFAEDSKKYEYNEDLKDQIVVNNKTKSINIPGYIIIGSIVILVFTLSIVIIIKKKYKNKIKLDTKSMLIENSNLSIENKKELLQKKEQLSIDEIKKEINSIISNSTFEDNKKYCVNCGEKIESNWKFCKNCGKVI